MQYDQLDAQRDWPDHHPHKHHPPPDTASSTASRRASKSTAFSGSSGGSSIYSYSTTDSSSYRGHGQQHWQLFGERPDISTVFEEEDDRRDGGDGNDDDDDDDDSPDDRNALDPSTRPLRYPRLHHQPSTTTVVSRTSRPAHRDRSNSQTGTIASNRSAASGHSTKSVHPFANSVLRPASPPPHPASATSTAFLAPHRPPTTSRSVPNLAESYKMTHQGRAMALVSTEDEKSGEDLCPICVESLDFTFRLPGEKPHIVPECGHALHEECFFSVYGDNSRDKIARGQGGVCGVCRQPMKLSEGGSSKRDKLATLMGQPGKNAAPSIRSAHGAASPAPDRKADDPVDTSRPFTQDKTVVVPSISIRSEFPVIHPTRRRGKQAITAMVTVEVPSAPERPMYPAQPRPAAYAHEAQLSPLLPSSPDPNHSPSGIPPTPISSTVPADPFAHVLKDLRARAHDYKSFGVETLGKLQLFDILAIRKGNADRQFHVYLFSEALICVSEEEKTTLRGKLFSSSSSMRSNKSGGSHKSYLRLKGRIYLKHVVRLHDVSTHGEFAINVEMEQDSFDEFVLVFKDRGSFETWRKTIARLSEAIRGGGGGRGNPGLGLGKSFADLASPSTAISYNTPGFGASSFPSHSPAITGPAGPGDLIYTAPLGPSHTPIDLVLAFTIPTTSHTSSGAAPLKIKLIKQSMTFVLALLGLRDRVALVTTEMGPNGQIRKTPLLNVTRYESRKRLEAFVEAIGTAEAEADEFVVKSERDDHRDVVAGVNTALDIVMGRKGAKNPVTGIVAMSDTLEVLKRAQLELVTARLNAAGIPVHAIGYGKMHDPAPLWMFQNHSRGTYTYVREWYHLQETVAGIVGGLMSVALDNMKLHVACLESEFRLVKVNAGGQAVVSQSGKDADVELNELRWGEVRELLLELEYEPQGESSSGGGGGGGVGNEQRYSNEGSSESGSRIGGSLRRAPSSQFGGLDRNLDMLNIADNVYEDTVEDEVPVCEIDLSFHDPGAGRSVARLQHPMLLTMSIHPPNAPPSTSPADPLIVRRRMELLSSDMLTRALLIASRKNFYHASRILRETKRIVETIMDGLASHVNAADERERRGGRGRTKREAQALYAMQGLSGPLDDIDYVLDGVESQPEMFERDFRNFSAQQTAVLRGQRAWTTRTTSERAYCPKEMQSVIQLSGEWQVRS